MKYTYLLINFFSFIIPFIYSFHRKIRFANHFRAFFVGNLITAFIFLIWDFVFTKIGVWGFSETYTTGMKIFELPLEEILFFFCIPFACVFTYYCLTLFYRVKWQKSFATFFVLFLSIILIIGAMLNTDRMYTFSTFLSTGILILMFRYYFQVDWLDKFFSVFPVLLIPFFIVNGLLTGSGLESPVVWYNDSENLGIRLFTIPVEDIVYAMELILLNVFFFERFRGTIVREAR